MPRLSMTALLTRALTKLRSEREKHLAAIAEHQAKLEEIDAILGKAGVRLGVVDKNVAVQGRKQRGRFSQTGEQSVLAFVKKHENPTTQDINAHWKREKRGGKADNTLTKLVKGKQLKRAKVKGGRGSAYSVA